MTLKREIWLHSRLACFHVLILLYLQVLACTALPSGCATTAITGAPPQCGPSASCSSTWSAATFPSSRMRRSSRQTSNSAERSRKVSIFAFGWRFRVWCLGTRLKGRGKNVKGYLRFLEQDIQVSCDCSRTINQPVSDFTCSDADQNSFPRNSGFSSTSHCDHLLSTKSDR